jgi:magnesium chelatase subunit D
LANGLLRSLEVLSAEQTRNASAVPWLVLVTDGRANVGLNGGLGSEDARAMASRLKVEGIQVVVIDTASSSTSSGAREIARVADGEYVRLKTMSGEDLASTVKQRVYT